MVRKPYKYPPNRNLNPMSIIFKLVRCLGQGTNELCFTNWEAKYVRLGHSPIELSEGHLAVYVGESEDEKLRVLVPITHLNHLLLGKLLEEAGKVFGFAHPGGITIPCGISEFERVQKIIATTQHCQRWRGTVVPSGKK